MEPPKKHVWEFQISQYDQSLRAVLGRLRTVIPPSAILLLAELNLPPNAAATTDARSVVAGISKNAANIDLAPAALVRTQGLTKINDGLHYDADGCYAVGKRAAEDAYLGVYLETLG